MKSLPHALRPLMRPMSAVASAVAVVAVSIGVAACGEKPAVGDGPYAELVAEFVPRIEKELGLPFKTPPKVERRSREEVGKFVRHQLESERGKAQVIGQEIVYRMLGQIPDTMQLAPLLQKLLEEQIVGYYDPATDVLYVVDGAPEALLRQTVAHELVHALQDQYVAIDSIQARVDDADRQVAAQAVLEGQAVYMQLRIDPNSASALRMPGGWDRIRDMIRDGSVGMPVFGSAPRTIREGLLFPYLGGADFVRRFIERRPEKELLTDLPTSTRQILSNEAYFTDSAGSRFTPKVVTLPAPRAGSVFFTNTFGEFETRLTLVQHLKNDGLAVRAATGWAGDHFAVIRNGNAESLVWATVWDSPIEAADFLDLMGDAARRRYIIGKQNIPAGATTRRYDVSASKTYGARTVTLALEQISGKPVVIYMDYPAGSTPPIDTRGITVSDAAGTR
ncbi:MAG: hypothetical protein IBJ03_11575 [Gemmatimonadaceae bacterium]|nr:hypothetical protein [Gemmatimonadaceae bacterium]